MNNATKIREVLQHDGYILQTVEKFNIHANKRKDLFGIIDVLALRENVLLGIQCTGVGDHGSHASRYLKNPEITNTIYLWLSTGAQFEIWAYNKNTKRIVIKEAHLQNWPVQKLHFLDRSILMPKRCDSIDHYTHPINSSQIALTRPTTNDYAINRPLCR